MPKLNQILAVEKGTKTESYAAFSAAHHQVQQVQPLTGIARTYTPLDDEGERFPDDVTQVQLRADEIVSDVTAHLIRLFDITATKDYANTKANADVKVDSKVLLAGVLTTYLLFLEKQLDDLHKFVEKLPTLDPSQQWHFDDAAGAWATAPQETTKTKKVMRNHVLAEATKEHPAQVQPYSEDVVVGNWKTIKFSGALPATRRRELLDRVTTLRDAVKFAREEANVSDISDVHVGKTIFDYLFA